jgi:PAS domain S-box-containing protein
MKKVLIVDDTGQDPGALERILRQHGYSVSEFAGDIPSLAGPCCPPTGLEESFQSSFQSSRDAVLVARAAGDGVVLESNESFTVDQQKRISEELRQANLVVENSPVVLFRWRAAEGWPVELVSANVNRFGYTKEELLSGSVPFSSLVHPDDLERVASEVQEHTARGTDQFQQEYRIVTRDGTTRWIDDRTVVERDAHGRVTHYQGTVFDITDRKKVEDMLLLTQCCVENASLSIFLLTPGEARIIYANEHMCRSLGYTREELTSMTAFDIDPYLSKERFAEFFREFLDLGVTQPFTVTHQRKDGTIFPLEITVTPGHFEGKDLAICFARDISEQKQAEQALRESEDRLRSVFRAAPIGIGVVRDRTLLEVNSRLCEMTGYRQEELVSVSARILYPDREEFERVGRDKYLQIAEKGTGTVETRWRRKDGAIIDILLASTPLHPSDLSRGVTFTALDITERKRAEEALRDSEEKFRVLAETSPAAIILHQGERFIYANPATSGILGYSEAELLEMNFWGWCSKESRDLIRERSLARLRGEPEPSQYEYKLTTKSGEERWVLISVGVIEYRAKPTVIATLLDITDAKRVEETMQAALAEKTVLLKEIHHRVKNNLQIISSLLDLQLDYIRDEKSRIFFRESQDRIRSMAFIHEKLYQSRDFASVDFAQYIESLSTYLFNSYVSDPARILLKVEAGEVPLGIDCAIPCGLIINELVSNALKHAFPDSLHGEISIGFAVDEEDWVTLTVADSGVGFPEGIDFENTETLGLQLVNMLVRQLKGKLSMGRGTGTFFSVRFWGRRTG